MIVRFNAEAEVDLEEVGDYIARDDPRRAVTFVRELRERCAGLSTFPKRFPYVRQYDHLGVRRFVHGRYLVFYRIEADAVAILHILHSAQDYEAILFPD